MIYIILLLRVPEHLRTNSWRQLRPTGSSYQQLVTWYHKWCRKLKQVNVSQGQILDQFEISVKQHFGESLKEVLKAEQDYKEKHGLNNRMPLEMKYQLLQKEVRVADTVKSLEATTLDADRKARSW